MFMECKVKPCDGLSVTKGQIYDQQALIMKCFLLAFNGVQMATTLVLW